MNEIEKFNFEKENNIKKQSEKRTLGIDFINKTVDTQYTYNFSWLGRPIIQYPQDMIAMQELIWKVKPDLIIETGIAHGGSLIFTASMLTLLETCGEIENGLVLGIDIDIREHNKKAIQDHPMSKKITMFEGSSVSDEMIKKVNDFYKKIPIKIKSLDDYIQEKNINQIDILKIDTEGFEFNVIKGVEKYHQNIKYIYFEHHYDDMIIKNYKFNDINEILLRFGFKKVYKAKMYFRKSFEYIYENSII